MPSPRPATETRTRRILDTSPASREWGTPPCQRAPLGSSRNSSVAPCPGGPTRTSSASGSAARRQATSSSSTPLRGSMVPANRTRKGRAGPVAAGRRLRVSTVGETDDPLGGHAVLEQAVDDLVRGREQPIGQPALGADSLGGVPAAVARGPADGDEALMGAGTVEHGHAPSGARGRERRQGRALESVHQRGRAPAQRPRPRRRRSGAASRAPGPTHWAMATDAARSRGRCRSARRS